MSQTTDAVSWSPARRLAGWLLMAFACGLLALATSLLVHGFGGLALAQDEPREIPVTLLNYSFEPDDIEVEAGETVRFVATNDSNEMHTFTVRYSADDTGDPLVNVVLQPGEEREFLFTVPTDSASLHLYCDPHADRMEGTLTVLGADVPPPTEGMDGMLILWVVAGLVLIGLVFLVFKNKGKQAAA